MKTFDIELGGKGCEAITMEVFKKIMETKEEAPKKDFEENMDEAIKINKTLELMATLNHYNFEVIKINNERIGKLLNWLLGFQLVMFLLIGVIFYNLDILNTSLL